MKMYQEENRIIFKILSSFIIIHFTNENIFHSYFIKKNLLTARSLIGDTFSQTLYNSGLMLTIYSCNIFEN